MAPKDPVAGNSKILSNHADSKGKKNGENGKFIPLPQDITLNDIVKTLPKEVFQKNMWKAWRNVLITIAFSALSVLFLHYSPWYLLPVAWFFAGTCATGLFVIGHDCGHLSFSRSHLLNDIVGTIVFLPLIYPFEPWRIQHNHHHSNTNKLEVDNAWQPFLPDYYNSVGAVERSIMRLIKGPFWFLASVGHQIKIHFFLSLFTESQRSRVLTSLIAVYAFSAVFFPAMLYNVGVWGLVKFWLIPWICFHFWMSTFTMVHHTLPFLPFLPASKWNDATARLAMTVHCEYPKWIEYLTHHINVHIPHHVSTGIPSYNLRKAHEALKKSWDTYMIECHFDWNLLRAIITKCHLYDEEFVYVPFDAADQEKLQTAGKPESSKKPKTL